MENIKDLNVLHENLVVVSNDEKSSSNASLEQRKKILDRVRERFETEFVGEGPHINHNSHQDHSDTYTP